MLGALPKLFQMCLREQGERRWGAATPGYRPAWVLIHPHQSRDRQRAGGERTHRYIMTGDRPFGDQLQSTGQVLGVTEGDGFSDSWYLLSTC